MKRLFSLVAAIACAVSSVFAQSSEGITIKSSNGLLSAVCHKPTGFVEGQKCPIVIIFQNLGSTKDDANILKLSEQLQQQGIATLLFDFAGQGASATEDFKSRDITFKSMNKDAKAIVEYAKTLNFVSKIGVAGYAMGGINALTVASEFGKSTVAALAMITPDLSLREDALRGILYGQTFDPFDLPRKLKISDALVLDRDFLEDAQKTNLLQKAADYKGETLLLISKDDKVLPASYADYIKMVMKNVKVETVEDIDHTLNAKDAEKQSEVLQQVAKYLAKQLK